MQNLILKPEAKMQEKLFASRANKIIVCQEHSQIYKSQQAPRINLRDVAIKLAEIKNLKFKLQSDSPSLESYYKYKLKPRIKKTRKLIIDMREQKSPISKPLIQELKNSKSSLIIINRLGAASLIMCHDCGYIEKCENCDVPLVYHIKYNKLLCHHCVFSKQAPNICKKCKSWNIKYLGTGIEKIEQEIAKLSLGNSVKISTLKQNLKKSDLIAVINFDSILNMPDFRASEKTFQNLIKLNNLAQKKLIIQTYMPEHYVFNFSKFYKQELKIRKTLNYPPFCQLIKLTYRHKNYFKAKNTAFELAKRLKNILGPAPAFIPKKRNFYYWNIILRNRNQLSLVPDYWTIDVDPINVL